MYKIIFDTNLLRNNGFKTFLGNKKNLEKFRKYGDILIPDMVIDEIKKQKEKNFNTNKNQLEENPIYEYFLSENGALSKIEIKKHTKVLEEESTPFEKIYLSKQEGILDRMKDLALNNSPPFEKEKDRGFKDAYIYFTILEYIESQEGKVFVATTDKRFQEALKNHPDIIIIESYKEFYANIIEKYKDNEYFISNVRTKLDDQEIEPEHVGTDFWKNNAENDILVVDNDTSKKLLEVDNNEIIGVAEYAQCEEYIQMLMNSESFETTKQAISDLRNYIQYFSEKNIEEILNASITNSKISYIATREDVKEFLLDLYESKNYSASKKVRKFIEGLKNDNDTDN